jgi:hypothetical protein
MALLMPQSRCRTDGMNCTSRAYRPLLLLLLALALLVPAASRADANWLSRILRHADDAHPTRIGKGVVGSLDEVGLHLKSLPGTARGRTIAVDATNEGHWRLRNADGETFTAATPEEFKRGAQLLAPMKAGEAAGHIFMLTANAVFRHSAQIKALPRESELKVLFDGQVLGLVRRRVDGAERYYLDAGGGVHVPITTRAYVHEALWQLARPVDLADLRVLALEPGATTLLRRSRAGGSDAARLASEAVDPERLPHMMSAVARGTIVITGRVAGPMLHYHPSSGPERTLMLDTLRKAAAASDVNLVVVHAASARQPGTRNWLWQRVDLTRLAPPAKPTLADLVRQLTDGTPVEVQVQALGPRRATLVFSNLAGGGHGWTAPVGDAWRDIATEVTGTIVAGGLQLDLRSREHQRELDDRIIPGIPAGVQFAYIGFWVLGLFGVLVAHGWWQRIWPLEARADYPRRGGYWAARIVRQAVFVMIFMPVVAIVSAPVALLQSVWQQVRALYAIISRPFRGRRAA